LNGNQFIADLMPKYPIYTILLPPEAQNAIGRPHAAGAAAMRLLEAEGFRHDGYVDLFDAGPTLQANVSDLRTVREARHGFARTDSMADPAGRQRLLMAAGRLLDFRAWQGPGRMSNYGEMEDRGDTMLLPAESMAIGRLSGGDRFLFVPAS
jgi:arginine N-succinyltransferase